MEFIVSKMKFALLLAGIAVLVVALSVSVFPLLSRHSLPVKEASTQSPEKEEASAPAQKETPPKSAAPVETVKVEFGPKKLKISAFGTVQPNRELTVQSEVKGRVIELSPNLEPGGILKKGEVMLKLDPADYLNDLEQNRVKVEKAEFELIVEQGRKLVAEKEWQLLDPSFKEGGLGKDLALRIPHLREKEASLQGAQSSLDKSLADFKRTVIRAPFNALVLDEFVEVGQIVGALKDVAKIVATDEFRVQVGIPYDQLSWLQLPVEEGGHRESVAVFQDLGDNQLIKRKGHILRILGNLDPNGRMVQVQVGITDPLNLNQKDSRMLPLLLGTYVEVVFEGPKFESVVEIPRVALREGNSVWVYNEEGKLEIRTVNVLFGDKHSVIIDKGLENGEAVILSDLPSVKSGMEIK